MSRLYTYLPKDNTALTEGLLSTALSDRGFEKYRGRTGKYTKEDVLKVLDSWEPEWTRSKAISALTEPIPEDAAEDFLEFARNRRLYSFSVKDLIKAKILAHLRRTRKGGGTDPVDEVRNEKPNWHRKKKHLLFQDIPHYMVETTGGRIPPEFVTAIMSGAEKTAEAGRGAVKTASFLRLLRPARGAVSPAAGKGMQYVRRLAGERFANVMSNLHGQYPGLSASRVAGNFPDISRLKRNIGIRKALESGPFADPEAYVDYLSNNPYLRTYAPELVEAARRAQQARAAHPVFEGINDILHGGRAARSKAQYDKLREAVVSRYAGEIARSSPVPLDKLPSLRKSVGEALSRELSGTPAAVGPRAREAARSRARGLEVSMYDLMARLRARRGNYMFRGSEFGRPAFAAGQQIGFMTPNPTVAMYYSFGTNRPAFTVIPLTDKSLRRQAYRHLTPLRGIMSPGQAALEHREYVANGGFPTWETRIYGEDAIRKANQVAEQYRIKNNAIDSPFGMRGPENTSAKSGILPDQVQRMKNTVLIENPDTYDQLMRIADGGLGARSGAILRARSSIPDYMRGVP